MNKTDIEDQAEAVKDCVKEVIDFMVEWISRTTKEHGHFVLKMSLSKISNELNNSCNEMFQRELLGGLIGKSLDEGLTKGRN